MTRAALVFVLLVACSNKKAEDGPIATPVPVKVEPVPQPPPARPIGRAAIEAAKPVEPPKVFPIDKLAALPADVTVERALDEIRKVVRDEAPELGMSRIYAAYVRKDGTLDPTYGSLEVVMTHSDAPDGIVDDPNRPTGAPIPEHALVEHVRSRCPTLRLAKGAWSVDEHGCGKSKLLVSLRCTVAAVWTQAIAAGAPADAVASVERDAALGFWKFTVSDKIRKVDFKRYVDDSCAPPAAGSGRQ